VFATDSQLNLLVSGRVIYFDSTFKVVPALYYQLFTVFVPHADHEFPVFFALMTRKTTQLYTAVLRKLGELVPQFIPSQVIADFEEAPAVVARAVFSDVTISGCWFHYAQTTSQNRLDNFLSTRCANTTNCQVITVSILKSSTILICFSIMFVHLCVSLFILGPAPPGALLRIAVIGGGKEKHRPTNIIKYS